jgi:manganese/zinc/iron transport system permease protein
VTTSIANIGSASADLELAATKTLGDETRTRWLIVGYVAVVSAISVLWFLRSIPSADYRLVLGTMITAGITNASCAIVGCYLVLRRMSLLGDAISHAVLPGIALAFLLTGQISGLAIIAGAMVLGIVTSVLSHSLHWFGKVSEDSSLGVVYTTLFALGVILLQAFASGTHLDADCVLYGQIDFVGLDTVSLAGLRLPRALLTQAIVLLVTVGVVGAFWKELKIVSFDPALAAAMGIRVLAVHYTLMAMVAAVSVAAFESVGSVLVVAMLVIPPAAAHVMSDRLRHMLAWAVVFGGASAVVGYLAARETNTTAAGMMAVVAGVQLLLAVMLSPQHGLVSRWLRNWKLSLRIASEDVIGQLYRVEEAHDQRRIDVEAEAFVRPQLRSWLERFAWWMLRRRGLTENSARGDVGLTAAGRTEARSLIRAHRLWESYLETHFSLPHDHLHEPAERMEHFLDPQLQAELNAELADRNVDPHGKTIPRHEP